MAKKRDYTMTAAAKAQRRKAARGRVATEYKNVRIPVELHEKIVKSAPDVAVWRAIEKLFPPPLSGGNQEIKGG